MPTTFKTVIVLSCDNGDECDPDPIFRGYDEFKGATDDAALMRARAQGWGISDDQMKCWCPVCTVKRKAKQ